ncbi:hypothetical protein EDC04DRAFT_2571511, partial [Pisolithus marmoratus]
LESHIALELSDQPNIVGTKLSCGNIGKFHGAASAKPSFEFATFAGTSDVSYCKVCCRGVQMSSMLLPIPVVPVDSLPGRFFLTDSSYRFMYSFGTMLGE